MKTAVTADLHLRDQQSNPERYAALAALLKTVKAKGINRLIIAGDLFDQDRYNYRDFDALCKDADFSGIQIVIIPGNHDSGLTHGALTAANVIVIDNPELKQFHSKSLPVLMIPYQSQKSMGEIIESFASQLKPNRWILMSHGDWIGGMQAPNLLEPGVYMPLTQRDMAAYQPVRAILGHIHKPVDGGVIQYPGSPLPLDINETGRRRMLIIDDETGQVESYVLQSSRLYLNETLTVLPVNDEADLINRQIDSLLKRNAFTDQEKQALEIRIRVQGYSADLRALSELLDARFKEYVFYKGEGIDMEDVFLADDPDRREIALRAMEKIKALPWPQGVHEPGKNQMVLEALHAIYGGR